MVESRCSGLEPARMIASPCRLSCMVAWDAVALQCWVPIWLSSGWHEAPARMAGPMQYAAGSTGQQCWLQPAATSPTLPSPEPALPWHCTAYQWF